MHNGFKIKRFSALSEDVLEYLIELETVIFEKPLPRATFIDELGSKKNLLVLIAFDSNGNETCGYKIGYEYSSNTFFSWSGGVSPKSRKLGIASALMKRQHKEALDLGYQFVRTHTKNKYREMLVLNIRSGFDVTGVYKSLQEAQQGIILEKKLSE